MAKIFRGWTPFALAGISLAALIIAALFHRNHPTKTNSADFHARATVAPASTVVAAATRSTEPQVIGTYLDVVKAQYPTFPATQPLGTPVEFSQAAHLILHDPIYLSGMSRAEAWVTRADGPDAARALADAADDAKDIDVHVLRDRVLFVHWMPGDDGKWAPWIVSRKNADGKAEIVSLAHGRQSLPVEREYRWEHAISWSDKVIVASARGISIFGFGASISESYHDLAPSGAATMGKMSEPRVLFVRHGLSDRQDLLAWMPWEAGKIGGGAARFSQTATDDRGAVRAEGTWADLTADAGWPSRILHMVPMLDGTVLMLAVDEKGAVGVSYNALDRVAVKEQEVAGLVDQLSDPDSAQRDAAFEKLSQYGPGIWPILEKLAPDQAPEAKIRLRRLLKQRVAPTLSGMSLLGKRSLTVAARLSDGGTVFYAEAGVAILRADTLDAEPDYRVPAWIGIRPGDVFRPLPTTLTDELTPGVSVLHPNGEPHAEVWIVTGDGHGPREFVGNGFVNLLRKSERSFSVFVGIDRRGRWFFQKPIGRPSTTAASTSPAGIGAETLIIDPTLPDPTPRLPVWVFNTADTVGWTKEGWPVAKKGTAYALRENDWEAMDEKEPMFGGPQDVPAPIEISAGAGMATPFPATTAATGPTTHPTSAATTVPTVAGHADRPILTDRDGNRYFGGLTDLRVVSRSGKETAWTLPPIATGKGPPWLVRTGDGRLFLFNQGGRVLRIKPTAGAADPFALEKIFTHRVPTVEHPTRVWLDPAGRIVMAWDNQLAIFFPSGYIPPAIAEKMVKGGDDNDDE
ncbi:MAG TPA: hypothetical protein VG326_20420 [Tepidisphaeraceae bacterium]|nr:hypothetical protein [Tepidisphaeraceae bacterium]